MYEMGGAGLYGLGRAFSKRSSMLRPGELHLDEQLWVFQCVHV
jgi:hypothetical protein